MLETLFLWITCQEWRFSEPLIWCTWVPKPLCLAQRDASRQISQSSKTKERWGFSWIYNFGCVHEHIQLLLAESLQNVNSHNWKSYTFLMVCHIHCADPPPLWYAENYWDLAVLNWGSRWLNFALMHLKLSTRVDNLSLSLLWLIIKKNFTKVIYQGTKRWRMKLPWLQEKSILKVQVAFVTTPPRAYRIPVYFVNFINS